jgi:HAD superfamily hydrolase (TIGR01549 family)
MGYILALQEVFHDHCNITLSEIDLLPSYHLHISQIINLFAPALTESEIDIFVKKIRQRHAHSYGRKLALFPYVKEVLIELSRTCYLATATNLPTKSVQTLFAELEIDRFFDHIKGTDTGDNPKPDPDILYATLDILELEENRCFMVGDSLNDIHAGKNAGIFTIGIDYAKQDHLRLAKPNRLISDMRELPPLINELSGSSDRSVVAL